jgi:capsular exopolysaccharide synthesis family protein
MSDGAPRIPRFDAFDAVTTAWRARGWIALGAAAGLALGAAYLVLVPKHYTSTTTILVETAGRPETGPGPAQLSMRERLQTLRYRIESDDWLAGALARVGDKAPSAEAVRSHIDFEVLDAASREAAVFRVSYAADDPRQARDVLTAINDELLDERSKERAGQVDRSVRMLEDEVAEAQRQIATLGERADALDGARAGAPRSADEPASRQADRSAGLAALQRVEEELARAESMYKSRHPALEQLYAERSALLRRMRDSGPAPPGAHALADGMREVTSQRSALEREYEASIDRYTKLVDRLSEVRMSGQLERDGSIQEIRVLRAPQAPKRADGPTPLVPLLGGTLLGALLAAAAHLARAGLHPTFPDDPHRLRDLSGLPVLAAIPVLRPAERTCAPIDPLVVAAHEPAGTAGERYRRLLPHLHAGPDGAPVVLVASAERGDGRTITAANLAAAVATADPGRQILAIDTDVRRPALHRLFGVAPSPGLAEVVTANAPLGQLAVATAVPNLHVLAAGALPTDATRLLASERFAALVEDARRKFQLVLLDAPPVGDSIETVLLSRVATLAVFVVRAEATPRERVAQALAEIGVPVGLLLNGAGRDA